MTNKTMTMRHDVSLWTEHDVYLFREGNHFRLYEKLGSHMMTVDEVSGTYFSVWAPNARGVSVIGDFNGWDPEHHALAPRWDSSGIWEGFIPHVGKGTLYKYHITSKEYGAALEKADPFAKYCEIAPKTASVVWDMAHDWDDAVWMAGRSRKNALDAPMSVYEVHAGSWARVAEDHYRSLSYQELGPLLVEHVKALNFTHVEFLPLTEHPFFGSWGYQTTGYFAPTSRFGTPQDMMRLVELLHQHDIGVIMDWVPSHFPSDPHGLCQFDGTELFEHADPRKGYHPDWNSWIFNYGRSEVRSFLVSSAIFWFDAYHIDGLRVDAVASMLYLDYSRKEGEWIANEYGGRENLEAISFLKRLNEEVYRNFPDVQMIAEESTAWPMVTRPTYIGGLGFGLKWNMGWMHDTLDYFSKDPVHRKFHHNELTFSFLYAFTENFALSLSHDEVVHGKQALLAKMPGDNWQKFANCRLLLSYMFAHPGKKLLFMGMEFGQWREWNHDGSLEWHLLDYPEHQGLKALVRDLNRLYRDQPALHAFEFDPHGFEWLDGGDWEQSVISFYRKKPDSQESLFAVCNFTPAPRENYRMGFHEASSWRRVFNSDDPAYGGSGFSQSEYVQTETCMFHDKPHSMTLSLPPLGVMIFQRVASHDA